MTPRPYSDAELSSPALTAEERDETQAWAIRVATDRAGIAFGGLGTLARFTVEQGAALEDLRAKVDAFLQQWDQPYVTLRGWAADLEQVVDALREHA